MSDFFFRLPVVVQGVVKGLAVILFIFPVAAACSMAERKVCAWIQRRPGPNRTIPPCLRGYPGMRHPAAPRRSSSWLADGGKFLFKEEPLPDHVHKLYFIAGARSSR